MKVLRLLIFILFLFAACKKEGEVSPKPVPVGSTTPVPVTVVKLDTIPDKAAFKIQLVKDEVNNDETMFQFNHKAALNYSGNDGDAPYFPGYGQESLASVTSDGRDLVINVLPYTSGMSIDLDMNAKASGPLSFKLSYQNKMPSSIHIWLKDTYLKDSVDVRTANYNFKVDKADANSFGNKRFKIILRQQ
jgi:hypothetical protein